MHNAKSALAAAALLALVFAGCSSQQNSGGPADTPASQPNQTQSAPAGTPGPGESPAQQQSPPIDCSDPNVSQDDWTKYCMDEPPNMDDVPGWYEASLDKTWRFVSPWNCRVTITPIEPSADDLTQRIADFRGDDDFYVLKADVNYQHPSDEADNEHSCGITNIQLMTEDGSSQEPTDIAGLIEDQMDVDDTDKYNEGVDLINTFIENDHIGDASVRTKTTDYAFFLDVKPYNAIQVYPHGMLIASQFAEQVEE